MIRPRPDWIRLQKMSQPVDTQQNAAPVMPALTCERCGAFVAPGARVCNNCGALVYRARLEQLAAEALKLEPVNPLAAAQLWKMCLDLLPPDSQQYQEISWRIGALAAGPGFAGPVGHSPYGPPVSARPLRPPDPPLLAATKTVGSMIVSILAYWLMFHEHGTPALYSLGASLGFVVLMLVHEMGHVFAMR